jgi:hypothetical protein
VKTFYTVDRRGTLTPEQLLTLIKPNINPPELQLIAEKFSPNGYSVQGDAYFLSGHAMSTDRSVMIDFSLELYRRSFFPDKPSRYSSMFACTTRDDAEIFKRKFSTPAAHIYEITCLEKDFHVGDMSLLTNDATNLTYASLLDHYWAGTTINATPFWEVLIPLPVNVGKRVA